MQKALFGEEVAVSGQQSLPMHRWTFIDWKPSEKIRFLESSFKSEYFEHVKYLNRQLMASFQIPKAYFQDETHRASSFDYASIEKRLAAIYRPSPPANAYYFMSKPRRVAKAFNFGLYAGFGPGDFQRSYQKALKADVCLSLNTVSSQENLGIVPQRIQPMMSVSGRLISDNPTMRSPPFVANPACDCKASPFDRHRDDCAARGL